MHSKKQRQYTGVSSIFSNRGVNHKVSNIEIGDRFRTYDAYQSIWIVDRVTNVASSMHPLVSLKREGQPDLVKTISIGVLQDAEEYMQLPA